MEKNYKISEWKQVAEIATRAMLFEVAVTPKPGLVDRGGSGVHMDMDYFTFMESSAVLAQGFYRLAEIGSSWGKPLSDLLPLLRQEGVIYEKRMLQVTKNINTHRGLLFLQGVITAAAAYCISGCGSVKWHEALPASIKEICHGLVERELIHKGEEAASVGQRAFHQDGLTGIRGEMERGLPAVFQVGLPVLESAMADGHGINNAGVASLLAIISTLEDTVVWKRGGLAGLNFVQRSAKAVIDSGPIGSPTWQESLNMMCVEFQKRNLSSGGAADVLAASLAVYFWRRIR